MGLPEIGDAQLYSTGGLFSLAHFGKYRVRLVEASGLQFRFQTLRTVNSTLLITSVKLLALSI